MNAWAMLSEYLDDMDPDSNDDYEVVITNYNKTMKDTTKDNIFWKYDEGKILREVEEYLSSTYKGHYVGGETKIQTLDLIDSIGDSEAFCRSNAIKYLSRYDKKGQAKRDILKALHYSLLLYHFSGQLNETPTRGYETF